VERIWNNVPHAEASPDAINLKLASALAKWRAGEVVYHSSLR
jgi:hypothetical protein